MTIFEGIQNRENSCWLISVIQMINVTNIYQFLYGKLDFLFYGNSLLMSLYIIGLGHISDIQLEYLNIYTSLLDKKAINILHLKVKLLKEKKKVRHVIVCLLFSLGFTWQSKT